jgi:hypothetical protein
VGGSACFVEFVGFVLVEVVGVVVLVPACFAAEDVEDPDGAFGLFVGLVV